jgi:hypothetical protein
MELRCLSMMRDEAEVAASPTVAVNTFRAMARNKDMANEGEEAIAAASAIMAEHSPLPPQDCMVAWTRAHELPISAVTDPACNATNSITLTE